MNQQTTTTALPLRCLAVLGLTVLGLTVLGSLVPAIGAGVAMASPQSPMGEPLAAQEPAADEAAAEEPPPKPPSLLGSVSREQVEAAEPDWVAEQAEAEIDEEAAEALAGVEPGADVVVYFGTWCGDSRRELSRFWRALDVIDSEVPFELEYIAVDRRDQRPPELEQELGLVYVPTFIVRRDGEEVGRMVEVSPNGIEHDLLALLRGEVRGVVSDRDDLGEP